MNRLLKVLGSIAAAIVLGAIGSGVWEKLLSPAISGASEATARLLARVSSSYEDSIYQRAARDTTDLYSIKISMMIMSAIGLAILVAIFLKSLSKLSVTERTQRRMSLFLGVQGLSAGLALVVLAFISMAKVDAASRIKEKSMRSLEIIRPVTGEQAYFELRSTYYLIEDKKDFDAFKTSVLEQASKARKKVPLQLEIAGV